MKPKEITLGLKVFGEKFFGSETLQKHLG